MKIIHDKCIFCIFYFLVYAGKKINLKFFKQIPHFLFEQDIHVKNFKENFFRKLLKNIEKSRNMHVYFLFLCFTVNANIITFFP